MAIRKRGDAWQIDYFDPTGKRVRKSFAKKKDARGRACKAGISHSGEAILGCKEGLHNYPG